MSNVRPAGLFPAEIPAGASAAQLRRTLYELEQRRLAGMSDDELAECGVYQTAPIPKATRVPSQRRARASARTEAAATG